MWGRLSLFTGNSNPNLAEQVASRLGIELGKALVTRFSDGEVRVEIGQNVRGRDAYVIQSTCPPVNENIVELLVMMDALKRASAHLVCAVVPYYGYGRQDQKEKPRVPLSAKMVADLFAVAGADRVITVDLHAGQIQGFFDVPVDHLSGSAVFIGALRGELTGEEIIIAPDSGGVERARHFAERLGLALALMDYREENGHHPQIVGSVEGRRVIILDDMVDTARTLVRTAQAAEDAGADIVDACCTHAVLSGNAVEAIEASPIRMLMVTDTVPLSEKAERSDKIVTVSVAPLLAEVIRRVDYDESISSLFAEI